MTNELAEEALKRSELKGIGLNFGVFRLKLRPLLQFTGQSGVLIAATGAASAIAYLLQVLLARGLSVGDFGTFATLQSMVYIVAVPVGTLSMIAAHFIAGYRVSGPAGSTNAFLRGLRRDLLPWGLGLIVVVVLGGRRLAELLALPSAGLIVVGGGAVVMLGALSVERGGLLGLGRVGHLGLNTVLEAVARFLLCLGGLWLGWKVQGVWLGWSLAYLVAGLAAWLVVRRASRGPASAPFDRSAVWHYAVPVIAGTGLLALMMHVDMIFVNAFFSAETAGAYAATLVYARVGLLPAMAVAPLTLSVTTTQHRQGRTTAGVLGLSLLLAAMGPALVALGAVLAPDLLVALLFGAPYAAAGPLLAPLALIYGLMALLFVYVRYSLAIGNYSFLKVLGAGALLEIAAFLVFHRQLSDVISTLLVTQAGLVFIFALRFGLQVRRWRRRR